METMRMIVAKHKHWFQKSMVARIGVREWMVFPDEITRKKLLDIVSINGA